MIPEDPHPGAEILSHLGDIVAERHTLCIRDRHGFERTVPISKAVVVGRQSHCDIVLSDSMISRTHLRIERTDDAWWVEDLGSSHGTFLKDERVTRTAWDATVPLRLADGAYLLTLKSEPVFASEVNLQAILQTAHLLTGEVELDDLLEQTMERLLTISGTDRGFIMLPEGGELVVKVQRNLGTDMEKNIHLSMSSVHKVFELGEAVWIHNVGNDENLMAQQSIMDLQLKTILCLPLMVQGTRIGVAYLDSRRIITEPGSPRRACATRCWPRWGRWPAPSSTTSRTPSSWWPAMPSSWGPSTPTTRSSTT
jgi:pSer/pThr/pTyr-binding forkhead associated (FHA) protein